MHIPTVFVGKVSFSYPALVSLQEMRGRRCIPAAPRCENQISVDIIAVPN